MYLLEYLAAAAALLLSIPSAVLLLEVLAGLRRKQSSDVRLATRPSVAILVPAHDEALTIGATVGKLVAQLLRSDRLIVIADNCSDDTAQIAERAGASVVVRNDPSRRGKGYALDFGVSHLQTSPPDIVIVVDADCEVAAGSIDTLARTCEHTGRPVQALYLMQSPPGATSQVRIAEFAWVVKNHARPSGLRALGLPCQLMGTGMAFPWKSLAAVHLATGHIVEDMKLGVDLACAGFAPLFCPEALVTSTFPTSSAGVQSQRTRWEHGHLSVILKEVPQLVLRTLRRCDLGLLALTLDLAVPPLTLLILMTAAIWCSAFVLFLTTSLTAPLTIASVASVMLACAVGIAWARYGRQIISAGSLGRVFIYMLWKIPLYIRFLFAKQVEWVRSQRDGGGR